jgi:hypothetical protein
MTGSGPATQATRSPGAMILLKVPTVRIGASGSAAARRAGSPAS